MEQRKYFIETATHRPYAARLPDTYRMPASADPSYEFAEHRHGGRHGQVHREAMPVVRAQVQSDAQAQHLHVPCGFVARGDLAQMIVEIARVVGEAGGAVDRAAVRNHDHDTSALDAR